MIFHESICAKLGGTMRIFQKSKKMLSEYPSLNHDQKLFIKRHTYVYNWCQDTICFQLVSSHNWFSKGSLIEGEQDFTKSCHGSLKWFHFEKMIRVWLCVPKWISHEFLVYLKIFQNTFFLTHNHPPSWIEGEHENCSKYQKRLNHTTSLSQNVFQFI